MARAGSASSGRPSTRARRWSPLGGAVARPGVYEIALGAPLATCSTAAGDAPDAAARACSSAATTAPGSRRGAIAAVRLDDALAARRMARGARRRASSSRSASRRVPRRRGRPRGRAGWPSESAGQCGPCVHGLPRSPSAVASLAAGHRGRDVHRRLERWSGQVDGRGACHHPDGVVRFLRSALASSPTSSRTIAATGPATRATGRRVLAVPDARRRLAA